jgi:hypothetical protein
MTESQELSLAIERLKKEVAEYMKFVAASSATRNSIAGLKEYGPGDNSCCCGVRAQRAAKIFMTGEGNLVGYFAKSQPTLRPYQTPAAGPSILNDSGGHTSSHSVGKSTGSGSPLRLSIISEAVQRHGAAGALRAPVPDHIGHVDEADFPAVFAMAVFR